MGSKIETVKKFAEAQRSRDAAQIDALADLLAETAVMANPRSGDVTGKAAILERLKTPPQGPAAGMMGQIQWSDPAEEGSVVKISASTPMGTIVRSFIFDDDEKISRIEFARG